MSFIVKGIDLPKDGELHLVITKNGIICGAEYLNKIKHAYPLNLEAEAIQIPKGHGRLIDGDEIQTILIREAYSGEYIERFPLGGTIKWTPTEAQRIINDNAPTILKEEDADK